MKLSLVDSLFARFFGLLLAAILLSHVLTTLLFTQFDRPPPPPAFSQTLSDLTSPPPRPRPPTEAHPAALFPPNLGYVLVIQVLVLGLAAWFGSRLLTRPIQRLAQGAEQLGASLHSLPIDEVGPQEVRQAARVVNQMQRRLCQQMDERARFLAAVSHDLRTPLTRLQLRLERVNHPPLQDAMRADIHEMAAMLNATLDYLRGEHESDPWQLLDVEALVDSMTENAVELGQAVSYLGKAEPIWVQPMALRRCLSNLLDNALRYGQRAEIALMDSPNTLQIEVRDAGAGIPEHQLTQVLEPFFRLDQSRNSNLGGVGLGLSIAREIALRHAGTLSLHNAAAGGLIARLVLARPSSV